MQVTCRLGNGPPRHEIGEDPGDLMTPHKNTGLPDGSRSTGGGREVLSCAVGLSVLMVMARSGKGATTLRCGAAMPFVRTLCGDVESWGYGVTAWGCRASAPDMGRMETRCPLRRRRRQSSALRGFADKLKICFGPTWQRIRRRHTDRRVQ